jgi:hypothetical protein
MGRINNTDAVQQMQMEDNLWTGMLKQAPKAVPVQIPSNNQSIAIPITVPPVTEISLSKINQDIFNYYFMCHQVDAQGNTLLDYCAHVDHKGFIVYCRNHNGP